MTTVRFRIERKQRKNRWQEYDVPVEDHFTVVDALEWIRRCDETLMYRHSCHHGSCGTCGMIVNGKRKLACTTNVLALVSDDDAAGSETADDADAGEAAAAAPVVELRPLDTMDHIGDLAVDPTRLFHDFPGDAGYLRPSEFNRESTPPEEIARFVRFENCIECGLCVSACPVIAVRKFTGPAALSAYNRELDKNPGRSDELLPQIDSPEGVWGCDRHLACSAVCPTGVYPAKQIAMLQRKIRKWREQSSGGAGDEGDENGDSGGR